MPPWAKECRDTGTKMALQSWVFKIKRIWRAVQDFGMLQLQGMFFWCPNMAQCLVMRRFLVGLVLACRGKKRPPEGVAAIIPVVYVLRDERGRF